MKQIRNISRLLLVSLVCLLLTGNLSCHKKTSQEPINTKTSPLILDVSKKPSDTDLNWKKIIGDYRKIEGKPEEKMEIREENNLLFLQYNGKQYKLEQDNYKEYRCKQDNPLNIKNLTFVTDKKGYTPLCKVGETYYERITFEQVTFDFANFTPLSPSYKNIDPQLVKVKDLDPTITVSLKFMPKGTAYLTKEAAIAIKRANQSLGMYGYNLVILDAYREKPIDGLKDNDPGFQKGQVVAVTLFNTKSQQPVDFGSAYLEYSERSAATYNGGWSLQRWNRMFLRNVMEQVGFKSSPEYWWKFTYKVVN